MLVKESKSFFCSCFWLANLCRASCSYCWGCFGPACHGLFAICGEVLSLVFPVSLRFCCACHDCKLSPSEFLIHLASQILFELAKKRELGLSKKVVSCLRSSGLLAAWKNWNVSQRVGLKSLTYYLFPQVQKTMQSFSKYSLNLSFPLFFFFWRGEKVEGFFYANSVVPHQSILLWKASLWCKVRFTLFFPVSLLFAEYNKQWSSRESHHFLFWVWLTKIWTLN